MKPAVVLDTTNVYTSPAVVAAGSVHDGLPEVARLMKTPPELAAVRTTVAPTSAENVTGRTVPPENVVVPEKVLLPVNVLFPIRVLSPCLTNFGIMFALSLLSLLLVEPSLCTVTLWLFGYVIVEARTRRSSSYLETIL
mgnify:FL=1